jgi:cytochrome b subunit of formate dehydrogenase/nitrate/TMAO reductase-like tetraheme cytochrome c subunit
MSRRGKTISLYVDAGKFTRSAHSELECVSCHVGFNPSELPHAKNIRPVNCVSCHDEDQFVRFDQSVHGAASGAAPRVVCADCHTAHAVVSVTAENAEARKQFALSTCSRCHALELSKYMTSDHGTALASGVLGAPTCIDCHDEHNVKRASDSTAQTSHANVAAMCLKCHLDNPDVRARVGPSAGFISSYEKSVHAQAVRMGNANAATCVDCHGAHDIKKGARPDSKVSRANIAETCGRCHRDVLEQYRGSIHGTSFAAGVTASATCTDCHGEHNILSPADTSAPTSARNLSVQVCSPCHASVRLTRKFGLRSDRFQSYSDSYHGLAERAGSVEVANCASCHGVHDIKPSSDSTSRISKKNLAKTCGTCHPGANENFTKGAVHVIATSGSERILYLVSTGYIVLIALVIGAMVIHNLLDFIMKSRLQLMFRRGILQRKHVGHRLYLRMSLDERLQHGALMVSFFVLVLTGFALKFPDAWWVAPIADISPLMFEARGILHRVAGAVLVLAGLYHCYYILFVPRGKQLIRDLMPVPGDVRDAIGVLKFNLGLSNVKPAFGRFSYIEKSEYWALVWGTIVMAATGIDNTFLGLLTKLWWDVAGTVHYYEAWLATLAIIVWHLYFVMFNPDIYPINLAFWKGTLTEEEMAEEHPQELEELNRTRAQLEAREPV